MQVNGAIIPPRAAVDAVAAVVRSVAESFADSEASSAAGKGILGRIGRRKTGSDAEDEQLSPEMLEHVPNERMLLPITGFGNLTTNDTHELAEVIGQAAAGWENPTVRFAGGTALDFPGDWSVWAKVDGDVEALMAVARGVTESVKPLGFFVDRRQFRPMLSVATVTPATTGPFLQAVVDALEAFRGEDWTAEISLTKETFVEGRPQTVELERIPLGR